MNSTEERRCPSTAVQNFRPVPSGPNQYPLEFARFHRLLKLREDDKAVVVGSCKELPPDLRSRLEHFHRKALICVRIENEDFQAHLSRIEIAAPPVDNAATSQLPELSNDAPAAHVLSGIITDAVRLGASDIHLEHNSDGGLLRYRIDGVLETVDQIDSRLYSFLANRVKLLARLNIMERRRPQDGRMSVELGGSRLDCRVATLRSHTGESVVVRLFPSAPLHNDLNDLGFCRAAQEAIESSVRRSSGLFLVTGPTGSGKSTTLNVLMRNLNSSRRKLVSIEDPIEQIIPGVVQTQIHEAIGLGFDAVLRSVLRHDPDVIMVGEIRDSATAELVVRASLTGHLVLSTLHTRDSLNAIARMRDLGVPAFLIAEVLQAVTAQRLVRRLCPTCKQPKVPSAAQRHAFEMNGLSVDRLFEPLGCTRCRQTGFDGRVPILELFRPNEEFRQSLAHGTPVSRLDRSARLWSDRNLFGDGLLRVAEGETTFEEVQAVVDFP